MSAFTELRLATKPAKRWFPKISVPIGYKGLEYRNGELSRELSPGEYRTRRGAMYTFVDMRERVMTLAPQDILTSDSVSLRVTMAVRASVVDGVAFTERASDPWASVYLAAQVALREVCAAVTVDEVITRADTVDTGSIIAATARAGLAAGIEVLDVAVKDVILPTEIRSAATELVTAKARGLAKLETARAETAALRSLANAGRVLDAHPALARLRLVQDAPYGTKFVVALSDAEPGAD
ncbi:slipin family protein [Gordonia sp. w5E2]|uniref:Stomatin/prohibitin-like protein n=1 Tax=Gordonia jacobaea TaxID=122202 RepID=A0ABR5I883_9ACTN|nr:MULTISPECIES: slipin family protein [Gordonia]KNA89890.1 stomatin/prohibitin-like protein [Gordonia jacobaea]